jgi:hypothetical protein
MKSIIFCCTVLFASLFIIGHQHALEAKHHNHFSFNVGTYFPGYAPAYVARPYPPAYMERRVYMDPYGYPMGETVYVAPRPYCQEVIPYPAPVWSGFSFGARFR